MLQALRAGDAVVLAEHVRNDLQAAALSLRPELSDALELGEQAGAIAGHGVRLGADSRVPGGRPGVRSGAAGRALRQPGYEALHVHGPVPGARVL